MKRCEWATDEILTKYHDIEWGVPVHNDQKLFEYLILDGMQSGLSWKIIIEKRKNFRKAFHNFNPRKIANYSDKDISRLLSDEKIIRNKQKIKSAINNAQRFVEIKKEFRTFDNYMWSFVNYKTKSNKYEKWRDIPSSTLESKIMSIDMKKKGFTFVGPTVCYAFMQTIGMVNDHVLCCFRKNEV